MRRLPPAAFLCGGSSTSSRTDSSGDHASSSLWSFDSTGVRESSEGRKDKVPSNGASAFALHLLFVGVCALGQVILVVVASGNPSTPSRVDLALALAGENTARLVNFRHSLYGGTAEPRLKFSRAALQDLAQRLFPSKETALKREKFLQVASRMDLTNQVLDLSPAYRVQQINTESAQRARQFGFRRGEHSNPLTFPRAVRTVFHIFVNRQQRDIMAKLHMENPELAKRLEPVDITPELRHLVASALPAIQPLKPTPTEKDALNRITQFYGDLDSTRQRLLTEAMKKVDMAKSAVIGRVRETEAAAQPTGQRIEAVIREIREEARQRATDAVRNMSPAEKLDFASAGMTATDLTDAVFSKLVEKKATDSHKESEDKEMLQHALADVISKAQIKDIGKIPNYAKQLTALALLCIGTVAVAYASKLAYKRARRRRVAKRQRPKVDEESLNLDLNKLVSMPMEALKEKAYAHSSRSGS